MKKTYMIPEMVVMGMSTETLIADTTTPSDAVTINRSGSTEAAAVEVKGNNDFNVWEEDWTH